LLEETQRILTTLKGYHPGATESDWNRFTIEDEFGWLEFGHGDLSKLLTTDAITQAWFAEQLPTSMSKIYEAGQMAVWKGVGEQGVGNPQQFSLSANWSVIILPLEAENDRYTVSVFIFDGENSFSTQDPSSLH
jgi:hypothetical protein